MSETNEIWKDIKNYEGYYQVSNLGRVRSVERTIKNGNRYIVRKGRISKQFKRNRYYFVILYKNSKGKNLLVHRLVAEAFIPNPDNLPCVNHLIPVEDDFCLNTVSNLEWCSYSKNNRYPYELNRRQPNYCMKGKFGVESSNHKAIYQIDRDTNKILKKFECIRDAGRELNISYSSITQVCKKMPHHLTAGGYKWRYVDE